jgi:hypothetical protein
MITLSDRRFVSGTLRSRLLEKLDIVFGRTDSAGEPLCARYKFAEADSIEQQLLMTVEGFPEANNVKKAVETWTDMRYTDRAIVIEQFRLLFNRIHGSRPLTETTRAFVQIFIADFVPLLCLCNN